MREGAADAESALVTDRSLSLVETEAGDAARLAISDARAADSRARVAPCADARAPIGRATLPEPAMPAAPQDLFAFLDSLAIAHETVSHPAVFTVEESKALRGQLPGGHTKNLFVKDKKGRLFLIVALEDSAIDLKRVHEALGAQGRVSFGSAATLVEVWGVEPGSVTPFGAINDREGAVTVALEARMMRLDRLNFHPLVNTQTTGLSSAGLVRFLEAKGHSPLVVELPTPPASGS